MDTIPIPKHEILNAEETKEILDHYLITLDELPRIRKGDPSLKGLDIGIGDIIKIIRNSPTAGESVYYRRVVD
ncbi:MAG: DNA-directed RNA polymerase subunit H [Candidatus Altiarchaeota archaeon]|nr:DNA-directed RNA polymerase subunit H [Candidatus Altiarchaeota archaeon]